MLKGIISGVETRTVLVCSLEISVDVFETRLLMSPYVCGLCDGHWTLSK